MVNLTIHEQSANNFILANLPCKIFNPPNFSTDKFGAIRYTDSYNAYKAYGIIKYLHWTTSLTFHNIQVAS